MVLGCPGLASSSSSLLLFAVVDFVSSDLEDVSQKCSLSYKVTGCPHVPAQSSAPCSGGLFFFFWGGEPTASIGVPEFPRSLLEVSLHPPGAGCGETSAAGPVLGLPCQRGRSLRGAQELHGHPAHREPQVRTAPGERPWLPCLWGGGGALSRLSGVRTIPSSCHLAQALRGERRILVLWLQSQLVFVPGGNDADVGLARARTCMGKCLHVSLLGWVTHCLQPFQPLP